MHFLSNDFNFDINVKVASSVLHKDVLGKNSDSVINTSKKMIFSDRNKFLINSRAWEAGWNILSKSTIKSYLEAHPKVRKISFYDFKINRNVKQKNDHLRAWTFKYNNRREIINGLGLIQKHCFVVMEL